MSIVSIGGGGGLNGGNTSIQPYSLLGSKNNLLITGCLPVFTNVSYPVLGSIEPENQTNKAFYIGGTAINTCIAPLPDNSVMYTGSTNRGGSSGAFIGNGSTSTGSFAVKYRVAPHLPLKNGTKISKASIVIAGGLTSGAGICPNFSSVGSATATGCKIRATLQVVHADGSITHIGDDFYNMGTISAGSTVYRDKLNLIITGSEYTSVAGDYVAIMYTFEGVLTSNPTSGAYISGVLSAYNYVQSSGSYEGVPFITIS